MSQFTFRLDPNYTVDADRAVAHWHVQPGLASSDGHSGDTLVGTSSTVDNSAATHAQVANAYEEPMVNYAYSQPGSSSVPSVPFHLPPLPSVATAPTQWHPPPNVFGHHSQPAAGPSIANSYAHSNYSQAYAGATGATGLPQEQQHYETAWVIMPGGHQFAIPVVVATVLMMSSYHRCGSCGSKQM